MGDVFLNIFNISVTASWIILAVIVLRFALKKAPRWITCALWAAVALRLLLPFSLESVLSLVPSAQTVVPPSSVEQSMPDIQTGIGAFDAPINEYIDTNFAENATQTAEKISFDGIMDIAALVWIVGVFAMLVYGVVSFLRVRHKVKVSIPYRENMYYCDKIASPFILGILRPRIYLPPSLSAEQMEYVILHEKAHLKRKDHLIKPLGFILMSIYWFNPLVWLAFALMCRDIELACDEKAIKQMDNQDKKGYSEALVSLSTGRLFVAACPLAFGEVSVKDRIKSIVNYKKPAFWTILVSVVLCVVFAVCFLTNPKTDKEPQNNSSIPQSEQGDISSLVTSESAQTETSSEAPSSDPSWRPSSSSRPAISNPFEGSSSMTKSEWQELDAENKERAYQLIKFLKQKDVSKLRYYNKCTAPEFVRYGFGPDCEDLNTSAVKTVIDKQEIKKFMNNLRLDTWYPGKWPVLSRPDKAICIDEDVKLGLICLYDGYSWLQISTRDGSYAYKAPIDLYSTLARDCELIKNPDEQTVQRLIEELKQTEPSLVRYYNLLGKNPLRYYPMNELDDSLLMRVDVDSEEIEKLTSVLCLDEWKASDMRMRDYTIYYIYFNENIYIALEGRQDSNYWVSIHTKDATAYYIVPGEVYTNIEKVLYRTR